MEERNMVRLVVCIALVVFTACQPGPSPKDEKAIIAAIQDETDAYLHRDHARWAGHWTHDSNTRSLSISNGYLNETTKWDTIETRYKDYFQDTSAVTIKIEKRNFRVRKFGNAASVKFDEKVSYPTQPGIDTFYESQVLLEKRNSGWLIAEMCQIDKKSFESNLINIESPLNVIGYRLLSMGKLKEAIGIFALNVQIFPGSWNAYDSLGEAYMKSGQKGPAIQNYEKSLKLNPRNNNAVEMLKKLKGK
jgi:tetratricopeptide (TPR) repeat protein